MMDNYAYHNQQHHQHQQQYHAGLHQHAGRCSVGGGCSHQMQLSPAPPPSNGVYPGCSGHGCSNKHAGRAFHQNTVVVSQPGLKPAPFISLSELGEREWTTGLCACFQNCASCICGFCCMPCFACYLSDKLGESCWGPFCGQTFMTALRTRQRSAFGIKGTVCKDLGAICFCPCCAMTQMYRELKNVSEAPM